MRQAEIPVWSVRGVLIFVGIASVVLGSCGVGWWATKESQMRRQEKEQHNRVTQASVLTHFADFQSEFGRIPKDLQEMETFLGTQLPRIKFGTSTEIELTYKPEGQNFLLMYPSGGEGMKNLVYDSTKPKAGWVSRY